MQWRSYFHSPDISLPVVRRYVADELLQLMASYLRICATRGRSLGWNDSFPSRDAYNSAVYRLKKAGLIAYQRSRDKEHVIVLTPQGEARLPTVFKPQRMWRKKWNGIWYVLVYDIPEKRRDYRHALREFLLQMRMGQLQKSVWIGAYDIRPQYHDLIHGAGIKQYAHLFEAQTVLGQKPREIVDSAWDFIRLGDVQRWYCEVFGENRARIEEGDVRRNELQSLAREELAAYLSAMEEDPLLPQELLPLGYHGQEVFQLHSEITRLIARALRRDL